MREMLQPGYGALLSKARQAREMSVSDVAAKLKLTNRQVEAIEAEDAAQLPGDVFMRGFVRNYARLVEVNPDELVTPLDAEETVSATITAPSEGVAIGSGGLKRWLVIPMALLIVFVAVVALVYQWLRQGEEALVPDVAVEAPATQPAIPQQETMPALPPVPIEVPSAVDSAQSPATPPAIPSPAPEDKKPEPQAAVVPAKPVKPATEPAPAPAQFNEAAVSTGSHVLRFSASQDAWIQVVDGNGRRFSKLVRAGGSDTIKGEAPFKLVVGEAAQVTMSYDGRVIDLTPYIGQKVARLTLE